jgi:hypothetical protein
MKMTDVNNDALDIFDLLDKNNIPFHTTIIYKSDGSNEIAGTACWLKVGHIEFDRDGMITNIVPY